MQTETSSCVESAQCDDGDDEGNIFFLLIFSAFMGIMVFSHLLWLFFPFFFF